MEDNTPFIIKSVTLWQPDDYERDWLGYRVEYTCDGSEKLDNFWVKIRNDKHYLQTLTHRSSAPLEEFKNIKIKKWGWTVDDPYCTFTELIDDARKEDEIPDDIYNIYYLILYFISEDDEYYSLLVGHIHGGWYCNKAVIDHNYKRIVKERL